MEHPKWLPAPSVYAGHLHLVIADDYTQPKTFWDIRLIQGNSQEFQGLPRESSL